MGKQQETLQAFLSGQLEEGYNGILTELEGAVNIHANQVQSIRQILESEYRTLRENLQRCFERLPCAGTHEILGWVCPHIRHALQKTIYFSSCIPGTLKHATKHIERDVRMKLAEHLQIESFAEYTAPFHTASAHLVKKAKRPPFPPKPSPVPSLLSAGRYAEAAGQLRPQLQALLGRQSLLPLTAQEKNTLRWSAVVCANGHLAESHFQKVLHHLQGEQLIDDEFIEYLGANRRRITENSRSDSTSDNAYIASRVTGKRTSLFAVNGTAKRATGIPVKKRR